MNQCYKRQNFATINKKTQTCRAKDALPTAFFIKSEKCCKKNVHEESPFTFIKRKNFLPPLFRCGKVSFDLALMVLRKYDYTYSIFGRLDDKQHQTLTQKIFERLPKIDQQWVHATQYLMKKQVYFIMNKQVPIPTRNIHYLEILASRAVP